MTDRDRLIELLEQAKTEITFYTSDGKPVTKNQRHIVDRAEVKELADYLLANGVVEVVRCKDCIYFQPAFILTNEGERRPYTKEEREQGFGMVSGEIGINCGSRCERFGYWEENKIPVWFSENDFCSYGELKEREGK